MKQSFESAPPGILAFQSNPAYSFAHKHRPGTPVLLLVAVLFLVSCISSQPVPSSVQSGWQLISSPNFGVIQNGLNGVAALSSNDVWAVGISLNGSTTIRMTLIEHWNGSKWVIIPSLDPGTVSNGLNGVTTISSNDVWAVGYSSNSSSSIPSTYLSGTHTLIEHWNGTEWSIVPSPNPGTTLNILNGVTAISSSDVWAVGYSSNSLISPTSFAILHTLFEHWNGTKWSIVSSPNPGSILSSLNGVTAISSKDIWAVGNLCCPTNVPGEQPLFERWNGNQWSVVQSPGLGAPQNILNGVGAVSANDVWAVGGSYSHGPKPDSTLIEHWNGSQWSYISSPNNTIAYSNDLNSVAAISSSDVWVVGYASRIYPLQGFTLIEHWNGTQWSIVPSPSPSRTGNNYLFSVAHVPQSSAIWAVGFLGSSDGLTFTPVATITEVWRP